MKANILKKLTDKRYRGALAAALCVGVLLLLLLPESTKKDKTQTDRPLPQLSDADRYITATQERLAEMISEIQGAGRAEVMLTCEGSEEYVYAADVSGSATAADGKQSSQTDSKLVTVGGSSDKQPVLVRVLAPRFSGALIVCDGADVPSVRERVINAVSAALDLPTSKICVETRR